MSLSSAMDTAKSSLIATQAQTAVLSRNIANVNTAGATRKYAEAVTGNGGQVLIKSITQSSNIVLYRNMLDANSAVGRGNVIANGLDRINDTIGDTAIARSPAALIAKLGDALNTLAASPGNYELARTAATAAKDVVGALNQASNTVQTIRADADNELVLAAEDMTTILAEIEDLNRRVVAGTYAGTDVTDLNDQRDQAVVKLSAYLGVTVQKRGQNDLVLYTDSGVTLFEGNARTVEYSGTGAIGATTEGAAFRIDGVAVTGSNAVMPLKSGSVAGLVELRDKTAVTYQTQLDEIARGLIETFKETSADGTITQGIFTASGYTNDASVSVGTFAAGALTTADVLTFDFLQGDITYTATVSFSGGVPATAADYQALLQTAVDAATPIGGGSALGSGVVTVAAGSGGALTLSTATAGALGISVSNVEISVPEKTGGLTAGGSASGTASTAASIAVGTYDATNGIAAGDTLTFRFTYDGVVYAASHTFTSAPANAAAFRTILESAAEAAVPVGGGTALGDGKIVVTNTSGVLAFATVAVGTTKSLALSGVGTIPKTQSAYTGGLVPGVSVAPVAGLAQTISLASAVTSDPTKIRDGVNYTYNLDGVGGYTARLNALSALLSTTMSFSATSDADTSASVKDYAASSVSWLQNMRKSAVSETEYKATLLEETQKTLSNDTGINMDEQLTKLIEIERSYQASSKLISTIDAMLETLLNSI